MITPEHNKIIFDAFRSELEKNASVATFLIKALGNLGNYATAARVAAKSGGAKGLLKHVSKFRSPQFVQTANGVSEVASGAASQTGMLQKTLGNMVGRGMDTLKGVKEAPGVMGKVRQLGTNIGKVTKQDLTNAKYMTVEVGSKKADKLLNSKMLKREVVGTAVKGGKKNYILKRSLPGRLLQYSMTPVGFGATTLASSPNADGAKEGLGEYAAWTWARPYAATKLTMDMLK